LIGLNGKDVVLGTGAHVRCLGKGRKQRCTPLRPETATMLGAWLRECHGLPENPVFPSVRGGRLSRDAIERLITKYTNVAKQTCPSLKRKKVSPHVLRHSAHQTCLFLWSKIAVKGDAKSVVWPALRSNRKTIRSLLLRLQSTRVPVNVS
jgi:integrase